MTKQVWVSPNEEGWKVKSAGADRAAGIFTTKTEAVEKAREIAINKQAELMVQDRHGQIDWRNSYGNDTFPPRG
jgi:hypothetical protein